MILRKFEPLGFYDYRQETLPKECRKERNEQIDAIAWLRYEYPRYADLTFHPANEGDVLPQYRLDLIKQGLLPGASDIICLLPGHQWPCGVFEMKRVIPGKSRTSDEQFAFLTRAQMAGHFAARCYGADAFKQAFKDYLHGLT